MVVDMFIISPQKDQFFQVFLGFFDFSKIKRPRPRLQKTNKWSFSVLVLFGLSPVWLQSFASPRTGLSNTMDNMSPETPCSFSPQASNQEDLVLLGMTSGSALGVKEDVAVELLGTTVLNDVLNYSPG